jgi:hypothetical protein
MTSTQCAFCHTYYSSKDFNDFCVPEEGARPWPRI